MPQVWLIIVWQLIGVKCNLIIYLFSFLSAINYEIEQFSQKESHISTIECTLRANLMSISVKFLIENRFDLSMRFIVMKYIKIMETLLK
jgi:hypothetical protein